MKINYKLTMLSFFTSAMLLASCTGETKIVEEVDKSQEIKSDGVVMKKSDEKEFTAEEQYREIFESYSIKLKEASTRLTAEYVSELKLNTEGINGLASLSNEKIFELADISNEGVQKMSEIMYKNGSSNYTEYESWRIKLTDAYIQEGEKIKDIYLNSAR